MNTFSRGVADGQCDISLRFASVSHLVNLQWAKEKSDTPSNFTLKLRKHLRTRRLEDVRQLGVDRIVDFTFGILPNRVTNKPTKQELWQQPPSTRSWITSNHTPMPFHLLGIGAETFSLCNLTESQGKLAAGSGEGCHHLILELFSQVSAKDATSSFRDAFSCLVIGTIHPPG